MTTPEKPAAFRSKLLDIDWDALRAAEKFIAQVSNLCSGEFDSLSAEEVANINKALREMNTPVPGVSYLPGEAKNRFQDKLRRGVK